MVCCVDGAAHAGRKPATIYVHGVRAQAPAVTEAVIIVVSRMTQRSMGLIAQDTGFATALAEYASRWPDESVTVALFGELLGDGENPFLRERLAGHFTASCWLVDASGMRTLLTHHKKLGLWLQLGGHADGERDLRVAALKEAEEESGLTGLRIEDGIFDLDRHWIPEHKGVPAHWHYDVRYVVRAGGNETYIVSDESHDLAWRDIAELATDGDADASVQRMARKWRARADA